MLGNNEPLTKHRDDIVVAMGDDKMADMEVKMVANMGVDKVADMQVDMVADMVFSKRFLSYRCKKQKLVCN